MTLKWCWCQDQALFVLTANLNDYTLHHCAKTKIKLVSYFVLADFYKIL